jgi:hypothetical protein
MGPANCEWHVKPCGFLLPDSEALTTASAVLQLRPLTRIALADFERFEQDLLFVAALAVVAMPARLTSATMATPSTRLRRDVDDAFRRLMSSFPVMVFLPVAC